MISFFLFFFFGKKRKNCPHSVLRSFLDLCIFLKNSFQDIEGSLVEVYHVVSQFRTFKQRMLLLATWTFSLFAMMNLFILILQCILIANCTNIGECSS